MKGRQLVFKREIINIQKVGKNTTTGSEVNNNPVINLYKIILM